VIQVIQILTLKEKKMIKENDRPEVTWEELCNLEPRLLSLFNEAQATRRSRQGLSFIPESSWYRYFKPRMLYLVGLDAKGTGVIKSSEAYNLAYEKIYNALKGEK
jgi:hypothetical protein